MERPHLLSFALSFQTTIFKTCTKVEIYSFSPLCLKQPNNYPQYELEFILNSNDRVNMWRFFCFLVYLFSLPLSSSGLY
jgi:hypothetical protein